MTNSSSLFILFLMSSFLFATNSYSNCHKGVWYGADANSHYDSYGNCLDKTRQSYINSTQDSYAHRQNQSHALDIYSAVVGKMTGAPRSFIKAGISSIDFRDDLYNLALNNKLRDIDEKLNSYDGDNRGDFESSLMRVEAKELNRLIHEELAHKDLQDTERFRLLQLQSAVLMTRVGAELDLKSSESKSFSVKTTEEQISIIKKENKELRQDLLALKGSMQGYGQELSRLVKIQQENNKKLKKEKAYLENKDVIKVAGTWSNVALKLISFSDPKLASELAPVVNATLTFVSAYNDLSAISSGALSGSAMGPYGMMAMAALSLINTGAQVDVEQQRFEAIMNALRQISEQILSLHTDMLEGFTGVHDHLFQLEKNIMDQFQKVMKQNIGIQNALSTINDDIEKLRQSVGQQNDYIHRSLINNFFRKFKRISKECHAKKTKYTKCLDNYALVLRELDENVNSSATGFITPFFEKEFLSRFHFEDSIGIFYKRLKSFTHVSAELPLHRGLYSMILNDIELYLYKYPKAKKKSAYRKLKNTMEGISLNYKKFFDGLDQGLRTRLKSNYEESLSEFMTDLKKSIVNYEEQIDFISQAREYSFEQKHKESQLSYTHYLNERVEYNDKQPIHTSAAHLYMQDKFLEVLDLIEENEVAANTRPNYIRTMDSEDLLSDYSRRYYWLKACSGGHKKIAVGVDFLLTKYRYGMKDKKHYGVLAVLNENSYKLCYNVEFGGKKGFAVKNISFSLTIIGQNSDSKAQVIDFKNFRKELTGCKAKHYKGKRDPYGHFIPYSGKRMFNKNAADCPTFNAILEEALVQFQEEYIVRYDNIGKLVKNAITAHVQSNRKRFIDYLYKDLSLDKDSDLDKTSFLLKGLETFSHEIGKTPAKVHTAGYYPSRLEIIEQLSILNTKELPSDLKGRVDTLYDLTMADIARNDKD